MIAKFIKRIENFSSFSRELRILAGGTVVQKVVNINAYWVLRPGQVDLYLPHPHVLLGTE